MQGTDFIRKMPKIDLHCHLDGSLPPETAQRILADMGETWTIPQVKEAMEVSEDCRNLAAYLACFDLPIRCLQTAGALEICAYDMAVRAAGENTVYLEARFAPSTQSLLGMGVTEAIGAVEKGLKRARQETGIETGIIVCAMRHLPEEVNLDMFRKARELLGSGVAACDIAGDEASWPMALYRDLFAGARRLGMPFTIHAGECGSRENIYEAMDLGASRIGHGTAAAGDRVLQETAARKGICFEICPTSNVQTSILPDYRNSPIREFMEAGIPVAVSTDNRTVSNTDLTQEFGKLETFSSLTREDMERIYFDSVSAAFAGDDVKERLYRKGKAFFGHGPGGMG